MKKIIAPILLALAPAVFGDSTNISGKEGRSGADTTVNSEMVRHSQEIGDTAFRDVDTLPVLNQAHIDLLTESEASLSESIGIPHIPHANPEVNPADVPSVVIANEGNLHPILVDLHLNNHPNHHGDGTHYHGHNGDVIFTEGGHETSSSHGHSSTHHNNATEVTDEIHFDKAFEFGVDRKGFKFDGELFYDPNHNRVDEFAMILGVPLHKHYGLLLADVVGPHGNMIGPGLARSRGTIFFALNKEGAGMIKVKFTLGGDNKH